MMDNFFGDSVEVPLLLALCTEKIKESLDTIKGLERIPDRLLIPILDKCTAQQLLTIENRIGREVDTEELWKRHCQVISPENKLSLSDDVETWRDLYTILEREYQNKTKKTGEALRKIYNNAANNKKSKQIKVLDQVLTPTSKRSYNSPNVSKTPSFKKSGAQSSDKYSTGGNVGFYSTSNNNNSGANKPAGSGSYSNVFKSSASSSNQPKLMAKVLKEHNKKFK